MNCNKEKYIKVRGHSHMTGKCSGSSHQIWNANYRLRQKILVIFTFLEDVSIPLSILYRLISFYLTLLWILF